MLSETKHEWQQTDGTGGLFFVCFVAFFGAAFDSSFDCLVIIVRAKHRKRMPQKGRSKNEAPKGMDAQQE